MSKVVEFKRPENPTKQEDLVWVCACGCTTWYAREDGVLQCAHCSSVSCCGPAGWRVSLPGTSQEGENENTFKMVGGELDGGGELWLRRHSKPGFRAAIILNPDGEPVTWSWNLTDEDRAKLLTALSRL